MTYIKPDSKHRSLNENFEEKLQQEISAVTSGTTSFAEQIFTKKTKFKDRCFGLGLVNVATKSDISWMVKLSHQKRLDYSLAQENFWKMAPNSDSLQEKWFETEIIRDDVIALCAKDFQGFVIGKIVNPPKVYDAGLTLMIDDLCVKSPDLWLSVGFQLLSEIISQAKQRGVVQILVVCGNHDLQKLQLLEKLDLSCASRCYAKPI